MWQGCARMRENAWDEASDTDAKAILTVHVLLLMSRRARHELVPVRLSLPELLLLGDEVVQLGHEAALALSQQWRRHAVSARLALKVLHQAAHTHTHDSEVSVTDDGKRCAWE